MARADTITIMPIDTWARIMAIHPCAWNQVVNPLFPYPTDCRATWLQDGWIDYEQGMILGRNEVADAISSAEDNMGAALKYPVAPIWVNSDEKEWPYPERGSQVTYPTIQASNGMLIRGGREAFTEVRLQAPIVYSDRSGDGVDDTAQIQITAAQMAAANASFWELAVYYPSDYIDYYLFDPGDDWRIRPLNIIQHPVTNEITISGHRCQFVRPELWLNQDDVDQSVDTNFLSYVDVYRRWTDPSRPAQIVHRSGTSDCATSQSCAEACQNSCLQVINQRLGEVKVIPAAYSAATGNFTYSALTNIPHAARLWYMAGYYRQNTNRSYSDWIEADWMETRLAQAITALSLSYLPDAVCGCTQTRRRYEQWTEEQDIDSLDAAMAQEYFGVVTKGSVFAASTVRRMDPIYGGGNL